MSSQSHTNRSTVSPPPGTRPSTSRSDRGDLQTGSRGRRSDDLPERLYTALATFIAWYSGGVLGRRTSPGVINIFFDENHNVVSVDSSINGDTAEVTVVVAWQASSFTPPRCEEQARFGGFHPG